MENQEQKNQTTQRPKPINQLPDLELVITNTDLTKIIEDLQKRVAYLEEKTLKR